MPSIHHHLSVLIILFAVFSAGVSFAQEDHISLQRIVGDFYHITISGERQGTSATVEGIRTAKFKTIYNPLLGDYPQLAIYAVVTSEGDTTATSQYSFTFQEELPGGLYGISYYVTDNSGDFFTNNIDLVAWTTLNNRDREFNSHYDDGYYFNLDLGDSSFETQEGGVFTIRNLKVQDVEDPIWARFQWNPRNLKFEFQEAGVER